MQTEHRDTAVGMEWANEVASFGRNLRRYRTWAGLTQRQLAALVGIPASYLHRMETGQQSERATRRWEPIIIEACRAERVRFEASIRISALELQERVEDRVAAHVSRRMGMPQA